MGTPERQNAMPQGRSPYRVQISWIWYSCCHVQQSLEEVGCALLQFMHKGPNWQGSGEWSGLPQEQ